MTPFAEEVEFGGCEDAHSNRLVVATAANDDRDTLRCEAPVFDWKHEWLKLMPL